jgi:hypothetical protein
MISVGMKKPVKYDSVAKVAIDKWYDQLSGIKQQSIVRSALRQEPRNAVRSRGIQGERISLTSNKPVLSQVDLRVRFNPNNLQRIFELLYDHLNDFSFPSDGSANGPAIAVNKALKFRLNKVKCIDETEPEFWGKDSISMGGTAVDDDETVTRISQFAVGDFDDDEFVSYSPPNVLKTFDLSGSYPKTFAVFLALAEKDGGGFGDFLTALYRAVKAEVTFIISTLSASAGAAIGAAIGGSVGAAVGGPIGIAIGIVAGLIVGALVTWLAGIAQDDLFEPQMTFVQLPTEAARFNGGASTSPVLNFMYSDFGGRYRVSYSWALSQ